MVEVIPVVKGALGMVINQFQNRIGKLGLTIKTETLQKTALLGTARIIKSYVNVTGMEKLTGPLVISYDPLLVNSPWVCQCKLSYLLSSFSILKCAT